MFISVIYWFWLSCLGPFWFFCFLWLLDFNSIIFTNSMGLMQSSGWAPILRPKTSKTWFGPVNFSVFILNYIFVYIPVYKNKFKNLIWPWVNANFHFEDCPMNMLCRLKKISTFLIISRFTENEWVIVV
jgi:hypothetical protein